ncbi:MULTISPECIES: amino acid ABC transporter permease [Vibrio]|uniref:amino acid ABC transporter permease n=1 Tax=Vibrio TaxID=662 RepID=UPI00049253A4|nr:MULTISPECIES: amino acid ABC transporter permease [Vibrio]MDH5880959.1 amino acid ABC transporter permease [Vibrio sp. S/42/10]OCH44764.1 amino acid ABC transporter permease [Vibrio cyclitrophicus]OEF32845.1 amino acid ABC transporter permease [Vibrio cyclitrophicus 1F97]OEF47813.1 amino acid ABC transporter permease [Vibrio cyclitrophicus 1F273]OEF76338.1 amino acid ABC transporter permease [Vibrio cyclitrophicus 1F111]
MSSTSALSTPKPNLHTKPRYQRLNLLDGVLFAIICAFAGWLYYRSSVGINYQWRWEDAFTLIFIPPSQGSIPYFFQGLVATLRLSLWSMVLALSFGTLLGVARHSKIAFFKTPALIFIQLVRNIPPLVFVFIFYFFVSNQLIPLLGLESILREHNGEINAVQDFLFGPANLWENLASGVICIGLLSSAYIAEVIRAGLESIPKGQWEAADSLGLSAFSKYRFVVGPQVLTAITPPLAGQAISLVKDTSIVSLISIQEMTFVGTEMANSSGLIFEIWLIVGAVYFALCFTLSRIFKVIEQRSSVYLNR